MIGAHVDDHRVGVHRVDRGDHRPREIVRQRQHDRVGPLGGDLLGVEIFKADIEPGHRRAGLRPRRDERDLEARVAAQDADQLLPDVPARPHEANPRSVSHHAQISAVPCSRSVAGSFNA